MSSRLKSIQLVLGLGIDDEIRSGFLQVSERTFSEYSPIISPASHRQNKPTNYEKTTNYIFKKNFDKTRYFASFQSLFIRLSVYQTLLERSLIDMQTKAGVMVREEAKDN